MLPASDRIQLAADIRKLIALKFPYLSSIATAVVIEEKLPVILAELEASGWTVERKPKEDWPKCVKCGKAATRATQTAETYLCNQCEL